MSDSISTTGNIFSNLTLTSDNSLTIIPNNYNSKLSWTDLNSTWYINSDPVSSPNPLQKLFYNVEFDNDDDGLLKNNIKNIKKNKIFFYCNYDDNNHLQPYEHIMELIENKSKFFLKIKISDILTVSYTNFQFIEIENNFSFNGYECDFSELKIKFKYDKILYENHKLSNNQIRKEKFKKILKKC